MGSNRKNLVIKRFIIFLTLFNIITIFYYITQKQLEENKLDFYSKRYYLSKLIALDTINSLNKKLNLESNILNYIYENKEIAYIKIIDKKKEIPIQTDNTKLPLIIPENIEKQALESINTNYLLFKDQTQINDLCEIIIPRLLDNKEKILTRVGFFRNNELNKDANIKFINTLIPSLIIILIVILIIHEKTLFKPQHTLSAIIIFVYLVCFTFIYILYSNNFLKFNQSNLINNCIELSSLLKQPASSLLEKRNITEFIKTIEPLLNKPSFEYMAIIQNDKYIFHTIPDLINTKIIYDKNYENSLQTKKTSIYNTSQNYIYEFYIPIYKSFYRLGTIKTCWNLAPNNSNDSFTFYSCLLFFCGLFIILFSLYLIAKQINKNAKSIISGMEQITAGNLQQTVYIDKNSELGEMALAFNSMTMSLNDRDLIGKSLQNYISKSLKMENKPLNEINYYNPDNFQKDTSIIIFIYFKGLKETIKHSDKKVIKAFNKCFNSVKNIIGLNKNIILQKLNYGLNIIITEETLQLSIIKSLNISELIVSELNRITDLPFSPKCSITIAEILKSENTIDSEVKATIFGETYTDFILVSKIQENSDIVVSDQIYEMVKSISIFEFLEILLPEQKQKTLYIFMGLQDTNSILNNFSGFDNFTKSLVLNILSKSTSYDYINILKDKLKQENDLNMQEEINKTIKIIQQNIANKQ